MSVVVLAVIPETLEALTATLAPFADVAREVQIDIVDGVFVKEKSWPYRESDSHIESLVSALPLGVEHELDLMIHDPLKTLPVWLATDPARVVIHIESCASDEVVADALSMISEAGSDAILSLSNDTALSRIEPHVEHIAGIQCMGIAQIGAQGHPFDERVLARIAELSERYPALPISVDGAVDEETILQLHGAGATRFVVGTHILRAEHPPAAYQTLVTLVSPEG